MLLLKVGGGDVVEIKIISSNDIMCHVHSHLPSHHIGKILDGQSFITGKRVLVVHNTYPKQKNLQARSPCSAVKICFWPYESVFKSPGRANFDREGRCNK